MRCQIIEAAFNQNVQVQADHAYRGMATIWMNGGVLQLGRVHNGDATATHHLQRVIRTDKGGRVFIQADADGKRVVSQGHEQTPEPVLVAEVLIDDQLPDQAQARRQLNDVGPGCRAALTGCNHLLGQERGSSRGAGHVHTLCIPAADRLGYGSAAQRLGKMNWVAPHEENPIGAIEHVQGPLRLAGGSGLKFQDTDPINSQIAKRPFITINSVLDLGGGRDDADMCAGAAAELREAAQDGGTPYSFSIAAYRDDKASCAARGRLCTTQLSLR